MNTVNTLKLTIMKKIFLYRFIAIVGMCLSSLLIKSENVACKLSCTSFSASKLQAAEVTGKAIIPIFNRDGIFIKI